jgi:uncharacterized DUF497 family protein
VRFEWDDEKAAANLRKHKVSFSEAVSIFYDPLSATGNDPEHSIDEQRFVSLESQSQAASWSLRTLIVPMESASSARVRPPARKETSMKKPIKGQVDELRPQYISSDFPKLTRGKYAGKLKTSSNVIILDPELADLFPNSDAVNAALRSLSEIALRARVQPNS